MKNNFIKITLLLLMFLPSLALAAITVPGKPTIGTATLKPDGTVSVSFTAPVSDGGSPIISYLVTANFGGFNAVGVGSPIVISNITEPATYKFSVRAINIKGTSTASSLSNSIVLAVPTAPTALVATLNSDNVNVSFAPQANGGSPITSYTIFPNSGGFTTGVDWAQGVTNNHHNFVTGSASPITISGLIGAAYTFTAKATNAVGTSYPSVSSNSITAKYLFCGIVNTDDGNYYYQCNDTKVTPIAQVFFGDTITNFTSSTSSASWTFHDGLANTNTNYSKAVAASYNFGGMYTDENVIYIGPPPCPFPMPDQAGLIINNPITGGLSCPENYFPYPASYYNYGNSHCHFGVRSFVCLANSTIAPVAYFGGMYSPGSQYYSSHINPITNAISCPSGYDNALGLTYIANQASNGASGGTYYCYTTDLSKPRSTVFGGTYYKSSKDAFNQDYVGDTNPLTSSYSCPTGFSAANVGDIVSTSNPPVNLCYTPYSCGNGIVESGEQCDDGSLNGTTGDSCSSGCTLVQTLSATTSASCGGKIKLSWNKVTGASSYKIFKNNLLLSTTTATSTEVVALNTDTFIFKSTFGLIDSASSTPPVSATSSASCFSASCSVNPASTSTGQLVIWTASSTGAVGPVTYKWTGDEFVNGKTTAVVSGTYSTSTPSIKHATTTVGDGISTTTIGCPGTGVSGGNGVVITEPVNNGVCVVGGQYMSKPTDPYLCLYGTATPTPVNGGVNGPWTWSCIGDGPGHLDSSCTATKLNPLDPNLICSLNMNPYFNSVSVDSNATWVATSTRTFSQVRWTISDTNGTSSPTILPGNTLNKIFTTVGIKTIQAELASSTIGVFGPPCIATTTIVLGGGNVKEQ